MAGRALTHGGMAGRRVFRVALVRARGRNRRRMQALRRLMELEMGETQLRVRLGAGGAAVAVAETADVKGVRVKGRLMRVQKQKTEIMLRFESEQDAIDAATDMMDAYGVDPEIQTLRDVCSPKETREQDEMGQIATRFLVDPELRRSVHALHLQLEHLLADGKVDSGTDELVRV